MSFDAGGFTSGSACLQSDSQDAFDCIFTALPTTQQYRPRRLARKTLITGPQTAIVTGPASEEVHVDEHGRVKVHFHWDRYGKYDEDSSCWVRVSQAWAGRGWGAMHIPRIGQEVIVEFLEGDPDRPIITGRVYNGIEKPPYDLPANKNISTIKSESTKGGGGFNEVKMDDTKGKELLYIQAEKDKEVRVKHDHVEWVGNESHTIIKKDQFEQIEGSKHLTVKGAQNEQVDGSVSLKAGADLHQKVGGRHALDVSQQIHLKAGATIVIEAGASITLKAGDAFITVGPAGVAISGTPVLINSGGSAGSGSGAAPEAVKAPREPGKPPAKKL
jgi:type VI secretion system secreted protein VgrG